MNNKIVDFQKILYPEKYLTEYILTYSSFNSELKDLIEKSGYVEQFKIKYYKGLRFLEVLGRNCVMQSKLFEKLVGADGIYSMRLKGQKNIRVLFSFQIVRGEEKVILYNAFQEKRTKDYSFEISKAKLRRRQLFGK